MIMLINSDLLMDAIEELNDTARSLEEMGSIKCSLIAASLRLLAEKFEATVDNSKEDIAIDSIQELKELLEWICPRCNTINQGKIISLLTEMQKCNCCGSKVAVDINFSIWGATAD